MTNKEIPFHKKQILNNLLDHVSQIDKPKFVLVMKTLTESWKIMKEAERRISVKKDDDLILNPKSVVAPVAAMELKKCINSQEKLSVRDRKYLAFEFFGP